MKALLRLGAGLLLAACAHAVTVQAQTAGPPPPAGSKSSPAPTSGPQTTPQAVPQASPQAAPQASPQAAPADPASGVGTSAAPAPALTGRVVDGAKVLDPATVARLTDMLAAHERATGQQVVVVTLASLHGVPIDDFGYQLGRRWGIGQKGKDNGALLIVARDDRKVRIEVGYGLEGQLTDAISSAIINQIIVPAFRQGNYNTGILDGTAAMLKVLGGDPDAVQVQPQVAAEREGPTSIPVFFILLFVVLVVMSRLGGRRRGGVLPGMILGGMLGGRGGFGGRGGGFGGGGGFSGGGGGFGGGGASGNW